jgi:hypothetical protein
MTTALTASVVEPDSIGTTLEHYLRTKILYVTFLKRMIAKGKKGEIRGADREAMQRRARKEQRRQEIEYLIAAHPNEMWAKAYVSAMKADAAPGTSQVA